ncbi:MULTISPECIES: Rnf electron transport complex subunit RnfE [Methanohalophilus]|jgi:electron transport complex protein RnfE|uniref:Ion-translocating oxidoreductase complex subunit E n=1 Tax=Methanohalophilus euhalobius TaxID=51203 RepID=A0A285F3Z7_9EURY|nr:MULTISPECIES: Rnf electron transport complex subunit RnfE [Methanohalophilus]KXS45940.1 MAG: electron transport complex protein RnfE [Methanohalophilus sp. T328-1]RSD33931.1 MAG: electron transport complex protein RnfE [Methanohalophilus sp.]OBZ35258.1 MAG: electron transport complex subunit RsxE [Methanohalophilus sp. DAL1]ODV49917.1 MAG: electron transport complex protein RnfE [Methanohalophilus sp. 2-GBenrich]PQV43220.1 electron transport complex protein RnfE [Methanohalophilus euhalobiu
MSKAFNEFIRGITKDNPIFALVLGLCPALAVTTSVDNAIGMSAGTAFVLVGANLMVSALRNYIPSTVRLPIFILIIATFVSIVDMVMEAYTPPLYAALGVFIPLIVVNCIIIGRAEAYANKNNMFYSLIDALGISAGFLLALVTIGGIRELLGTGQIVVFGQMIVSIPMMSPASYMILPPGAFLTIGILMAIINHRRAKKLARGE